MKACVVVPARDEEELIGACIAALAAQDRRQSRRLRGPARARPLHRRDRAACPRRGGGHDAARHRGHRAGVGHARRQGMDLAAERLPPDGLIATTDADSEPAPDWLRAQLDAVDSGARAIGGRIELGTARPPARRAAPARGRRRQAPRRRSRTAGRARAPPVQRRLAGGHGRDLRAGRPAGAARGAGGRGLRARAAPPRRADRAARGGAGDDVRPAFRPRPPRARGRPAPQRLAGGAQLRRRSTSTLEQLRARQGPQRLA